MGFLNSPLLPAKIEKKIFDKVVIHCVAGKCVLQFDNEKWEFVQTGTEEEWQEIRPDGTKWPMRNVTVFPRMETVLKDTFQDGKVPVRIKELHNWNWFRLPQLFKHVEVEKLQLAITLYPYVNSYLSTFRNKKELSHVTVINYRNSSKFLDDLRLVECDYLLLVTNRVDEPSKMTGFKAKRWEVSESCGAEYPPPLILEFVDKMMSEKPDILTEYEVCYSDKFDTQPFIYLVLNKYPNAQLCGDEKKLLTIKLEDREVNVYQSRRYKNHTIPFWCSVRMEEKGTVKPNMNFLERFSSRKYDELCVRLLDITSKLQKPFQKDEEDPFETFNLVFDYFLDNPLLIAANLLLIPLLLAVSFFFSDMYPPFLVLFIIFNVKTIFTCFIDYQKKKDPFLFSLIKCK